MRRNSHAIICRGMFLEDYWSDFLQQFRLWDFAPTFYSQFLSISHQISHSHVTTSKSSKFRALSTIVWTISTTTMPLSLLRPITINVRARWIYQNLISLISAKSDDALVLYAQCLMRANRISDAFELLKKEGFHRTSQTRFLYAKCAYELKKWIWSFRNPH